MKSALILDTGEVGLALALRAAQAGWKVFHYIEDNSDNNAKETGQGMHPNLVMVDEWIPYAAKADLVVAMENSQHMTKLDRFRRKGVPVYAATEAACRLEVDRSYGMKWLEERGVKVPPYKSFKTLEEVEKYVRKKPEKYVIKPAGDCNDKSLSFVSKSPGHLLQQIATWKETGADFGGDIIVQEFIKGVEFGVSCWMSSKGFIGFPCENFEHKKNLAGELGVGTGEQGTISKYVKDSKLFDDLMVPLEADLVKLGCLTDVDLNCIIAEDGTPYVLEFTMRPGIPIFNMQLFAHKGDPLQWMLDACKGRDTLSVNYDVMIGVVLTLPDFPYSSDEHREKAQNVPLYGLTNDNMHKIQPQGVKAGKFIGDDMEVTKGWLSTGNYVACAVEMAPTIKEARDKMYGMLKEVHASGLGYRDDIGEKVIKALPELQKHGFASDWEK